MYNLQVCESGGVWRNEERKGRCEVDEGKELMWSRKCLKKKRGNFEHRWFKRKRRKN